MKQEKTAKKFIRQITEGRAARVCAGVVSVFLCALTLLEFTALEMEWEIPVLEALSGENTFWMLDYRTEEVALEDSVENVLLEEAPEPDHAVEPARRDWVLKPEEPAETEEPAGTEELTGTEESTAGTKRPNQAEEIAEIEEAAGTEMTTEESNEVVGTEEAAGTEANEEASAKADGLGGENTKKSNKPDKPDSSSGTDKVQPEHPYYIRVNRKQNCITIYTPDENGEYTVPYKAMICSTGLYNATPQGKFQLSTKYLWRELYGGVYGQYATRIHGGVLFHSVPYYRKSKSSLCTDKYNKLGQQASMGCIRLTVEDAKWIAENCPAGTTVEIYEDENPGPLGKPEAAKIDTDSPNKGWDPTDPDADNPWKDLSDDR